MLDKIFSTWLHRISIVAILWISAFVLAAEFHIDHLAPYELLAREYNNPELAKIMREQYAFLYYCGLIQGPFLLALYAFIDWVVTRKKSRGFKTRIALPLCGFIVMCILFFPLMGCVSMLVISNMGH